MVNCFPHALSGLKHVADFFFQSTDLLNHCENIESSVAYIYSWIYGLCLNHQFITFIQKKQTWILTLFCKNVYMQYL